MRTLSSCVASCVLPLVSVVAQDARVEVLFEARELGTIPADVSLVSPHAWDRGIPSRLAFSADGRRFAYVGHRNRKRHPIVNDTVYEPFDMISAPRFSENGKHVVFRCGNNKSKTREQWWALLDGKKGKVHDWLSEVSVDDKGQLAFWDYPGARLARDGSYTDSSAFLRYGRSRGKTFKSGDVMAMEGPKIIAKGTAVASLVQSDRGVQVLKMTSRGKSKALPKKGLDFVNEFVFSPDGKRLLCSVSDGPMGMKLPGMGKLPPDIAKLPGAPNLDNRQRLSNGEREWGTEFDAAGVPVFSPDSRRFAFKFEQKGKMGVAFDSDKKPKATHTFVGNPVFSSNGKALAYAVYEDVKVPTMWRLHSNGEYYIKKGKARLVVRKLGGKEQVGDEEFELIEHLTFDSSSRRVAFAGMQNGKWHVVVGKQKSDPFDEVGALAFDRAGKRIAFSARSDKQVVRRVLTVR